MKLELVEIDNEIAGFNIVLETMPEIKAMSPVRTNMLYTYGETLIGYCGNQIQEDDPSKLKMCFLQKRYHSYEIKTFPVFKSLKLIPVEEDEPEAKSVFVCTECGSEDVEIRQWVQPNEGDKPAGNDSLYKEDCWCNDCGGHTNLEIKKN